MKNEIRIKEMNLEQITTEIKKDCEGKFNLEDKEQLKIAVNEWMKKEK